MSNFLKKYWTHILGISYFVCADLCFLTTINQINQSYPGIMFFIFLILLVLLTIGVFIEMIIYIIHAAKNKEAKNNVLCAVLCYFFNVFYIPCYSLKYISKDEDYKRKNTIYLVISIILYISLSIIAFKFALMDM